MKKSFKLIIGVILCLSMLLSFVSCQYIDVFFNNDTKDKVSTDNDRIVPRGYTGGVCGALTYHYEYAVYWLETYEEVLSAIELLKSHGSTIKRDIIFTYDTDMFDVKYCFEYKRSKAEPLEEGKNFFDRKIDEGSFQWYAFYDDVEIDDFMYIKTVGDYDVMCVSYAGTSGIYRDFETVENTDYLSIDWYGKDGDGYDIPKNELPINNEYDILYKGKLYCHLIFSETCLPEECYRDFLSTLTIIE